jgi:hypothetical protein
LTSLTSECYDGSTIRSLLTTNKDGAPVVTVEHVRGVNAWDGVNYDDVRTWDVAIPPNTVNAEDHLAFEHREAWRDHNDRKLV